MLILVYFVYIYLYLCEIYEVHASYPLKYVTNTNYLKTNNIFPTTALCLSAIKYKPFIFLNLCQPPDLLMTFISYF